MRFGMSFAWISYITTKHWCTVISSMKWHGHVPKYDKTSYRNVKLIPEVLTPGPDSRNDPLAIGSDMILWSRLADRIPQMPITIGSSGRKNTKPNSLLPIGSWHKSFNGKFRTEITRSRLHETCQTSDIYSWRHNGRCGDAIYVCRYESVMASSVHAHRASIH